MKDQRDAGVGFIIEIEVMAYVAEVVIVDDNDFEANLIRFCVSGTKGLRLKWNFVVFNNPWFADNTFDVNSKYKVVPLTIS